MPRSIVQTSKSEKKNISWENRDQGYPASKCKISNTPLSCSEFDIAESKIYNTRHLCTWSYSSQIGATSLTIITRIYSNVSV